MKRWMFGAVFVGAMVLGAVVYAFTEEKILNSWFISADQAIRIVIVP